MPTTNKQFSLKNFWKHTDAESEAAQFGRDARADWQVACFIFLFLNILSIGTSIFVYRQINKGEFFLVDKKEPVSIRTLNRFELERTVSFFEDKRARFEALKRRELSTSNPFTPKAPSQ